MRRLVFTGALIALLVAASGCGHVAGNYPVPKKRPPALPDTYEIRGETVPVVWERAGKMRAFAMGWLDPQQIVPRLEKAIAGGYREGEKELRILKPLADKNKVLFNAAFFLTKDGEVPMRKGQLEITFSDGSKVRDGGAMFREFKKSQMKVHDSRNKTIKLRHKYSTERGKPVVLSIILPADYLNKDVTRVGYAR